MTKKRLRKLETNNPFMSVWIDCKKISAMRIQSVADEYFVSFLTDSHWIDGDKWFKTKKRAENYALRVLNNK